MSPLRMRRVRPVFCHLPNFASGRMRSKAVWSRADSAACALLIDGRVLGLAALVAVAVAVRVGPDHRHEPCLYSRGFSDRCVSSTRGRLFAFCMNWNCTVSFRDSGAVLLRCCSCVCKLSISRCCVRLNLPFPLTRGYVIVPKCQNVVRNRK